MAAGLYGIWSPDRSKLYVGTTGNLAARLYSYRAAVMLGCAIEVGMDLGEMPRTLRNRLEDRIILALRARGVPVVNATNAENQARYLRHSTEQHREWAKLGLGKLTKAQRSEYGRMGQRAMTREQLQRARAAMPREAAMRGTVAGLGKQTTAQRRANGLKGAEARWRKEA